MIAVHEREHASVLALLEVAPENISAYGCAECDDAGDGLRRVRGVVEKPQPRTPSNLAVIGRYVFTPGIFDAIDRITPGVVARSSSPTRSVSCSHEAVFAVLHRRPLRLGQEGRLPARQHRARRSPAPTSGPELEEILRTPSGAWNGMRRDPPGLGEGALVRCRCRRRSWPRCAAEPVRCSAGCGLVLAERVSAPEAVPPFANTAMDDGTRQAGDTTGATAAAPVRLRVVGELAAGHAPTVASGPARRSGS